MENELIPILQASPLFDGLNISDSDLLNLEGIQEVELPQPNDHGDHMGLASQILIMDESPTHDFYPYGLTHFRLGTAHIAHILKELKEIKWSNRKVPHQNGKVRAQLHSDPETKHVQLELYLTKDNKGSHIYTFRLYCSSTNGDWVDKLFRDDQEYSNGVLLEMLLKDNRPFRIACLLKDL